MDTITSKEENHEEPNRPDRAVERMLRVQRELMERWAPEDSAAWHRSLEPGTETMAYYLATDPVTEILPGMKSDGLILNRTGKDKNTYEPFDVNPQVYPMHVPDNLKTPYGNDIYNSQKPEIAPAINEAFKGQIVVDLGAGGQYYPAGYLLADRADARGYIGVEPSSAHNLVRIIAQYKNCEKYSDFGVDTQHPVKGIPVAVVAEDMLGFLRRIPDDSVSIFCSGIDSLVINDGDYWNAVAKEIERVLDPAGAYVAQEFKHIRCGLDSRVLGDNRQSFSPDHDAIRIYRKS